MTFPSASPSPTARGQKFDANVSLRARAAKRPWRPAALIGLAATLISCLGSWIPSLWGDEAASVMSAQRPLPSLLGMLTHVDAVHGSYYLFLHFWIDLFGASPFSVRLPPAIAVGVMATGVVILVAELATTQLALFTGIVCCLVPRVTYMGEETRTYAVSSAYAAWAIWVLVRLIRDRTTSRRWWIVYGALMAAATYVFLYSALFFVVHFLILMAARVPRAVIWRWWRTSLCGLVLSVPLLVFAYLERAQVAFLGSQTNVTVLAIFVGLWFSNIWFAILAWLLILAGIVGAIIGWRRRTAQTAATVPLAVVALLWLLIPAVTLILSNGVVADFTSRYMSYSAPATAIMIALGIDTIVRGRWQGMLALTMLVAAVAAPVYFAQRGPYAKNGSDWTVISTIMGEHAIKGDAIVFDDGASPSRRPRLALHTYPAGFVGLRDVTLKISYEHSDTWYDRTYTVPETEALGRFATVKTVWLVEYVKAGQPDSYGLADLASAGYHVQTTYKTHSGRVIKLTRPAS